jgi:hypothetical protein
MQWNLPRPLAPAVTGVAILMICIAIPGTARADFCATVTYLGSGGGGEQCGFATLNDCNNAVAARDTGMVANASCHPRGAAGGPGQVNAAALQAAREAAAERQAAAEEQRRQAILRQGTDRNEHALKLESQGDWSGAVKELRQAYALNPHPTIRENLAYALYKLAAGGDEPGTRKQLEEAIQLAEPAVNDRDLKFFISSAISDYDARQAGKERQAAASGVIHDNLALASAEYSAPAVGAPSTLSFSGAPGASSGASAAHVVGGGNSGGLGMAASPGVDVGPARSAAISAVPDSMSQLKFTAAGSAAAAAANPIEVTKAMSGCGFDNAGKDCPSANSVPTQSLSTPAAAPITHADVLAGKLGALAKNDDVRNALAWYRTTEGNATSAQADVNEYAALVQAGGPDTKKYTDFLDSAKAQLAIAQHDQDTAKGQVAAAVGHYGVQMPDDAP